MHSQRNTLLRSVAGLTGDVAIGIAIASACLWLIEFAALGMFLSFLLWLLGTIVALALSQYILHPTIKLLLADRKLDSAIAAATLGTEAFMAAARLHRTPWANLLDAFAGTGDQAKEAVRSGVRGFANNLKGRRTA